MRRDVTYTVPSDPPGTPEKRQNRDAGKKFFLQEMPALQAERWANRAILAIGNSGSKIDYVPGSGMAGIFFLGFKALLSVEEPKVMELLDEMMGCVRIIEEKVTREITPDDIEEVRTLWKIREELFLLHTGFSWAEMQSMLISAAQVITVGSSNIQSESLGQSQPLSPEDTQAGLS